MRIKKGDTVKVLSGNDKDKTGEVLEVLPKQDKVIVKEVRDAQTQRGCHYKLRNQHDDAGLDGARRGLKADAGAHEQQDRGNDGVGAAAAGSRKEAADLKDLWAEGIEQKADDHRIDHDVARDARYLEFLLLAGGRFLCHETPISADAEQKPTSRFATVKFDHGTRRSRPPR